MPEARDDEAAQGLEGLHRVRTRSRATPAQTLAPKALESEIFSALLEGAASFHVSQQRAMAAATDNADELGQNLSRIMNRARQDSITTEIMEIVGGAEALRSGK
jgi:F-type H+-transporting ATPase subunit gamma